MRADAPIEALATAAYRIPTDRPEADGTYAWSSTTLVTVHLRGGGAEGFGYTYASAAVVPLLHEQLAPRLIGQDALDIERNWNLLVAEVRNVGRAGVAANAISAVDVAMWDLKAKLLGLPLVRLLGEVRPSVPVYGSGGFTSYTVSELSEQLGHWAEAGFTRVKMKIGTHPERDGERVAAAREAIGSGVGLMVDANGAYRRKQALAMAHDFTELGVEWFEEPVSSDDLEGLHFLREAGPPGMQIAAGEYGYDPWYFARMLRAEAVDVLQADATRCLGITGFLAAARLCQGFQLPLSAHTAPSIHAHVGCAATPLIHLEYFHDHARIERLLFDGFIAPRDGNLSPDRSRPGIGVELKRADAERYR